MIDKIKGLLEERFKEEDMKDCFLIGVDLNKGKKLSVFIDSDEGITFKKCSRISRFLEAEIEENSWLPSNYSIDVSSPGADKPLVNPRQYMKHIGRELELKLKEEKSMEGILESVHDDHIVLKSGKENNELKINFDQIIETRVKLKFK